MGLLKKVNSCLVGAAGIEPTTSRTPCARSTDDLHPELTYCILPLPVPELKSIPAPNIPHI